VLRGRCLGLLRFSEVLSAQLYVIGLTAVRLEMYWSITEFGAKRGPDGLIKMPLAKDDDDRTVCLYSLVWVARRRRSCWRKEMASLRKASSVMKYHVPSLKDVEVCSMEVKICILGVAE
jgi:hypothetical protein